MLKKWYNRNRSYLQVLLFASGVVGLIVTGICFCFPSVLVACASLTVFGVTPLAFLMAMHLPLALLTLTGIMTGMTFCAIATGIVVVKQLARMGAHVYALCAEEERVRDPWVGSTSYDYLQTHLKKREYTQARGDEEEIASSPVDFEVVRRPSLPGDLSGFSAKETNSVNAFSP